MMAYYTTNPCQHDAYEFNSHEHHMMAYYTTNYCQNDADEFNFSNPYGSGYDVVPHQDLTNYSVYEFNEPNSVEYHPNSCYDPFVPQSYSTYQFGEPKFLQYEPTPHDIGYFSSQTHFVISYSTTEFNEPEWEAYDPTPYGGGYDIVQTYGKPLQPSDQICYPRLTPMPENNSLPPSGFSLASIPSPYGKGDSAVLEGKPQKQSKQIDAANKEEQKPNGKIPPDGSIKGGEDGEKGETQKQIDSKEEEGFTNSGSHNLPDSESANGNGTFGGYEFEYDRQVPQYQYGYGLEAMDLCEGIFGYWPCLAKQNKKKNWQREGWGEEGNDNQPWQMAADYIFGSPYGQRIDDDQRRLYGYCRYGHECYHYQ